MAEDKKQLYIEKSNLGVHKLMVLALHIVIRGNQSDNTIYTCSYDQEVCAFDVSSGKEFFKFKNPNKTHFLVVKWSKAEQELIVADELGYVMFINVKGEKNNHVERLATTRILGVDIVRSSPYMLVATEDEVMFYRINKGFQVQKLPGGHAGPVLGLFYIDFKKLHSSKVKSSSKLVSIGDDNTLRVWDAVDQAELACFACPPETEVLCMEYLSRFGLMITGHENGDLYMWDIEVGNKIKLKHKMKGGDVICCLSQVANSESFYLLASGYSQLTRYAGKVQIWEFTEKKIEKTETLVYPQLKSTFFANPKLEREKSSGEEVFALACHQQKQRIFAAGNSTAIFMIQILRNATVQHVGQLEVASYDAGPQGHGQRVDLGRRPPLLGFGRQVRDHLGRRGRDHAARSEVRPPGRPDVAERPHARGRH